MSSPQFLITILMTILYIFQSEAGISSSTEMNAHVSYLSECDRSLKELQAVGLTNAYDLVRKTGVVVRRGRLPWIVEKEIAIEGHANPSQNDLSLSTKFVDSVFQAFLHLTHEGGSLSTREQAKIRDNYKEPLFSALSQRLYEAGITHKIVYRRNVIFQERVTIVIEGAISPEYKTKLDQFVEEMAERDVEVVFDMKLGVVAGAAYIPSTEYASPPGTIMHRTTRRSQSSTGRRQIQLPILSLLQFNVNNSTIDHEVRHLNNHERSHRKEKFPFYGRLDSPMGSPFFRDPDLIEYLLTDVTSVAYEKMLFLDELDTYARTFPDLYKVLQDPTSYGFSVGDDKVIGNLITSAKQGYLFSLVAQKLAPTIKQLMKDWIGQESDQREKGIKFIFDEKLEMYWLDLMVFIKKKPVYFTLALVESSKENTPEELVDLVEGQMNLLMENARATQRLFAEALKVKELVDLNASCSREQLMEFLRLISEEMSRIDTDYTSFPDKIDFSSVGEVCSQ